MRTIAAAPAVVPPAVGVVRCSRADHDLADSIHAPTLVAGLQGGYDVCTDGAKAQKGEKLAEALLIKAECRCNTLSRNGTRGQRLCVGSLHELHELVLLLEGFHERQTVRTTVSGVRGKRKKERARR